MELRYSEDHLWFRRAERRVSVGVTEQISRVLTWVTRVDLPAPGAQLDAGEELVTIDSQKTVFVLPAPVGLEVITVNEELLVDPMLVRMEPRRRGWLVEATLEEGGWEQLIEPDAYDAALSRR